MLETKKQDIFDQLKLDHFDRMDVFDVLDEIAPSAPPAGISPEIKALIDKEVASRVKWQIYKVIQEMKPPERVIETKVIQEKMIAPPEKVIVKETKIDHKALEKAVEKKFKKSMDEFEKSGKGFWSVVVPSSIADQNGHGGQVLSTNGSNTKWIDAPTSSNPAINTGDYPAFILSDSSSKRWSVTVDATGHLTTTLTASGPTGALIQNAIVLRVPNTFVDSASAAWAVSVNPAGNLVTASVAAAFYTVTINTSGDLVTTAGGTLNNALEYIPLIDSTGLTWLVTVLPNGDLDTN